MIVKVALEDSCVASAGVMFAKKAGLPQLLAGSTRSQGVAFPPHSKFVVFTALTLAVQIADLDVCLAALEWHRRESGSQGTMTSRSCMQMVLSYFACLGCT